MNNAEKYVLDKLIELHDNSYKIFQSTIMPTVDENTIIGVRIPKLRDFAKEFVDSELCDEFLTSLPHKYYDENNLHGLIIELTKDYKTAINQIEAFLPYVDNWATCDLIRPKIFKKHKRELLKKIKVWLESDKTYTVRFAIEMLMIYFVDKEFKIEYAELVAGVKTEEYYVKMMIAWFFATALAKQYDLIIPYLENNLLPRWIHNKTIQKACESYRITREQKAYLRSLKIN